MDCFRDFWSEALARRLTGCNWAYEVIEGMEAKLGSEFIETLENSGRESLLQQRSGLSPTSNGAETENVHFETIPLDDSDDRKFTHLAPSTAVMYGKYKDRTQQKVLQEAHEAPSAPRPKIIVIDLAWDPEDPLLPKKSTFLTRDCEILNKARLTSKTIKRNHQNKAYNEETNPYLKPYSEKTQVENVREISSRANSVHHGAACVGVLRVSSKGQLRERIVEPYDNESDDEAPLWNLSPRADILLLPLREYDIEVFANYSYFFKIISEAPLDAETKRIAEKEYIHKVLVEAMTEDKLCSVFNMQKLFLEKLNFIFSKFPDLVSDPESHDADLDETLTTHLFKVLNPHFEESGLVKTLSIVEDAAAPRDTDSASKPVKYIGRGDTLVMPLQVNFWRKKVQDSQANKEVSVADEKNAEYFFVNSAEFDTTSVRSIDLPVIVYKKVEHAVKNLTEHRKISVIVSAGNSHLDLGQIDIEAVDEYLPTKRFPNRPANSAIGDALKRHEDIVNDTSRRLFQGRGCHCGAILVGSGVAKLTEYWANPLNKANSNEAERVKEHHHRLNTEGDADDFANYGLCIDASGRGSAKSLIQKFENKDHGDTVVAMTSYHHWDGASIAAMIVAACLANVQHIRVLGDYFRILQRAQASNNLKNAEEAGKDGATIERLKAELNRLAKPVYPLKPYEARAHIQQWRSNEAYGHPFLEDLMGAPPDIKAWFEGAGHVEDLDEFAKSGRERIKLKRLAERAAAE